jgi:hypothetical protein
VLCFLLLSLVVVLLVRYWRWKKSMAGYSNMPRAYELTAQPYTGDFDEDADDAHFFSHETDH